MERRGEESKTFSLLSVKQFRIPDKVFICEDDEEETEKKLVFSSRRESSRETIFNPEMKILRNGNDVSGRSDKKIK